jgi:Flp pilus assembly protein TadD
MRGAARTRAIAWFACGAMTALAAQARANILIFLVFYPVFALYLFMKSRRAAALAASLALAGAFFTLAVFGIVNISQSGRFQLIPNAGGINLYLGNKLTADGMIPKQDRAAPYHDVYRDSAETFAREEYISAMAAEGRKPSDDPLAISDYWTRRAIKEIGKDPVRWAGLMGKKAFFVFWNHEITNNKSFHFFQEKESLVLRILPVGWFLLLALAPLGVISAGKSGDREILFMILCFLALFAVNLVIFFVNSRYRFPMWPMMAVLAGGGLNYFLTAAIKKNWRTLFASLLLILGISIFSLVNWCNATPPSYARDYYFRSLTEYQRGQLSRALDDVRQSLRLDPGDFEASLHLGNVLFALKRYDEAKSAYLNMAERFRPEERVWNNIGVSCEALRDYAGAYRAYGEALKINGADMVALQNMILLEIRGKSFDRAAEKIARLKQLDKDNVVIMCAESFLKKSGGCAGEARMLADKAYKTEPDTAAWIFDLLEKRPVNPEDLK